VYNITGGKNIILQEVNKVSQVYEKSKIETDDIFRCTLNLLPKWYILFENYSSNVTWFSINDFKQRAVVYSIVLILILVML